MILGPDNRRAALRVDASGRLITSSSGGGGSGFAYTGTWAGRPAANSLPARTKIVVTDVGEGGYSEWYTDGTNWRPVNGIVKLVFADLSSVSYSNTVTLKIAGWDYTVPEGMMFSGARLRTMLCASRTPGGGGQWTMGVNFRKGGSSDSAFGNYCALYGTSTSSLVSGQALGVCHMTDSGMRISGGWGFSWSGGGSSSTIPAVVPPNSQNPAPGEAVELFLVGQLPSGDTATMLDVTVELLA